MFTISTGSRWIWGALSGWSCFFWSERTAWHPMIYPWGIAIWDPRFGYGHAQFLSHDFLYGGWARGLNMAQKQEKQREVSPTPLGLNGIWASVKIKDLTNYRFYLIFSTSHPNIGVPGYPILTHTLILFGLFSFTLCVCSLIDYPSWLAHRNILPSWNVKIKP